MKNVWLRDLERAPEPKAKKYLDIRPISAPERVQGNKRRNESVHITQQRPPSSGGWRQSSTGTHKSGFLEPINPDKAVSKTRRILKRASHEDLKFQSTGPPPGHIARELAEKREKEKEQARRRMLRQDTKVYNFTEDITKMLSFGQFDCKERPEWDERFIRSHIDKREQALAKRKEKRAREKALSRGQNAISVTMRDVLEMYTLPFTIPKGKKAVVRVPLHLNDDELHVWYKGRMALYHAGTQVQHKNLQQLFSVCRQRMRSTHDNIVIVHFLRFVNVILGGTSSFQSAKVILLKDLNYLHRLIQNVNPMSLPLDYLRAAVTFRMKELEKHGHQFIYTTDSAGAAPVSSDSVGDNADQMSAAQQSAVSHLTQSQSVSHATMGLSYCSTSVLTESTEPLTSWEVFIQNIQSWVFSLSLLGKIILVSAERTPINILMSQKKKNSNNALTVLQKSVYVSEIKLSNILFSNEDIDVENDEDDDEDDEEGDSLSIKSNTSKPKTQPRHRLSVILGVTPGSTPYEPYNLVNNIPISPSPEIEVENEEDIDSFRRKFFGVRSPAKDFRSLSRMDSKSYGDLEELLRPYYGTAAGTNTSLADESIFDDAASDLENMSFDNRGSPSGSMSPKNGVSGDQQKTVLNVITTDDTVSGSSPMCAASKPKSKDDKKTFLEVDGYNHSKFRVDKKGNIMVVGRDGHFSPTSKNMALYYDMITPGETADVYVSGSKNETKKLTAVDMFPANKKVLSDVDIESKLEPGETPEQYWKRIKDDRIKENHDFVEALCRLSEVKDAPLLSGRMSPAERSMRARPKSSKPLFE
mmetsp:Transcript_16839/g.25321  ORF Transcript_16839/g.25321 Transcript_16839/m.25321 type:complete len:812 (+) Transcript_16839:154-2589(+)|eukprot:CAMPEP_0185032376 /NCGR_PEP_ID=MMETSP1103-20130426/20397_1 /TAXON_ID=36769 /ORGANISM="Paraphysomonas bandaiensis, Strain Caron Lab Isolate" /LENGTH=811 /DNA_ID=CAMNT_0027568257 /DNA_START=116 /DNA_END=2551 /DNA_ORIENTATION=+